MTGDITLDALARFLEHPVKQFLRQRLGVRTADEDDDPHEGLPVTLDPLEKWSVGDRLLVAGLGGASSGQARKAELLRGLLPPGQLGTTIIDPIIDEVAALIASSASLRAATSEQLRRIHRPAVRSESRRHGLVGVRGSGRPRPLLEAGRQTPPPGLGTAAGAVRPVARTHLGGRHDRPRQSAGGVARSRVGRGLGCGRVGAPSQPGPGLPGRSHDAAAVTAQVGIRSTPPRDEAARPPRLRSPSPASSGVTAPGSTRSASSATPTTSGCGASSISSALLDSTARPRQ